MAFAKVNLQDWENLVQKQLKTENIYDVLVKPNLEGINVKPYYNEAVSQQLPKIEESTQLVAPYFDFLEDDVYAIFTDKNVVVAEKSIYFSNPDLAENLTINSENKYFSLVDVFNQDGTINKDLVTKLLDKKLNRSISVDLSLYQNAGASITQQLALALTKTKELVEVFGASILNQLAFRFAIGHQYFLEIAKLRAFKYLFNQLSKEYNLNLFPYIYAETTLRNKSIKDEENNLIRSTLELSSAMIGGADAVYANNYKLSQSTELSQEISFKQMVVLAYESIINVFEDATSGSYLVEDITRQLSENAWTLFLEIEEKGGFTANIESGFIQNLIYNQAIAEQNWVAEGKIKLIGVNLYPTLEAKLKSEDLYQNTTIKPVRWAEMFE